MSRQLTANRDEDVDSAPPIGLLGARRFNEDDALCRGPLRDAAIRKSSRLLHGRDCLQDCVDRDAYGAKLDEDATTRTTTLSRT